MDDPARRHQQIQAELSQIGLVLPGSLTDRTMEAYRFCRHLYYATCAILVSIPSSYSEGVRYPSPF